MVSRKISAIVAASVLLACGVGVQAIIMETIPVGNPGNAGEWSGESYGGYGSDRICGAVGYTYNIGKYEVTTGQYAEFLNKVASTDTYGLYDPKMWTNQYGCKIQREGSPGSYTYTVASDYANRPVNCVSWGDAARFANWMHNGQPTGAQDASTTEDGAYPLNGAMTNTELLTVTRKANATWAIPTEDEWYKAAYHKNDGVTGNYWLYPTSSDSVPSNQLIGPDPGNNANFYQNGAYTIDSPYWRTEVGTFENSASPYGTYDQGGNMVEWNETVLYGTYRQLRGGYFGNDVRWMLASVRSGTTFPSNNGVSMGFRVVQVPEPGSALLLLIGCAGLISRKRRT